MFIGAVSSIALLLSAGPELVTRLQAVIDTEAQTERTNTDVSADTIPGTPAQPVGTETTQVESATESEATPLPDDSESDNGAPEEIDITDDATPPVTAVTEPVDPAPILPEAAPTPAADNRVAAEDWADIMADARAALAATKTAQGRFYQTNADGSTMLGDFALNRPGKLRFDYDDPTPVLIVADGATVAIEDSELETIDRVPLVATPLGIILDREIDFDGDVEVLDIRRAGDRIGIEMRDAAGEMEGTLTLIFAAADYELLGWIAVDGSFQSTLVNLTDVETNISLDPRLFRLDDDEDEEEDR